MVVAAKAILHTRPKSYSTHSKHRSDHHARPTRQVNSHQTNPGTIQRQIRTDDPQAKRHEGPSSAIATYIDRFRNAPAMSPNERKKVVQKGQSFWWINSKPSKSDQDGNTESGSNQGIQLDDRHHNENEPPQNDGNRNSQNLDCSNTNAVPGNHRSDPEGQCCSDPPSYDCKVMEGERLEVVDNNPWNAPNGYIQKPFPSQETGQSLSEIFSSIISKSPQKECREMSTSPDRFPLNRAESTESNHADITCHADSQLRGLLPSTKHQFRARSQNPSSDETTTSAHRPSLPLKDALGPEAPSSDVDWANNRLMDFAQRLGSDEVEDDDVENLLEEWRVKRGFSDSPSTNPMSFIGHSLLTDGCSLVADRLSTSGPGIFTSTANGNEFSSLHIQSSIPASCSLCYNKAPNQFLLHGRISKEVQTEHDTVSKVVQTEPDIYHVSKEKKEWRDAQCQTDQKTMHAGAIGTDAENVLESKHMNIAWECIGDDISQTVNLLFRSPEDFTEITSSMFNTPVGNHASRESEELTAAFNNQMLLQDSEDMNCSTLNENEGVHPLRSKERNQLNASFLDTQGDQTETLQLPSQSEQANALNRSSVDSPAVRQELHLSNSDADGILQDCMTSIGHCEEFSDCNVKEPDSIKHIFPSCGPYSNDKFREMIEKLGVKRYSDDMILQSLLRTVEIIEDKIQRFHGRSPI